MCGIAGIHVKPSGRGKVAVGALLDWLLIGIESRGTHATGFVSVNFENEIILDKAPVPAKEFISGGKNERKAIKGSPRTVLAHTRFATQGAASENANNHPVMAGSVFVTHNGHIANDWELFKTYDWQRNGQVDTEAIPALLYEKDALNAVDALTPVLEELEGGMAIAAVDANTPDRLLLAKGCSSPLVYIDAGKFVMWASTMSAIKLAWTKVLGTPPAETRFSYMKEGQYLLYEDGQIIAQGTFDANPGYSRYYSGASYSGYSGYSGSRFGGEGITDRGKGYHLVTPTGGREWVSLDEDDDELSMADLDVIGTFKDWARDETNAYNEAIYDVADETDLPCSLVEWVLFHASDDIVMGEPALKRVKAYLQGRMEHIATTILGKKFMELEGEARDVTDEEVGSALVQLALESGDANELDRLVAQATISREDLCASCGQASNMDELCPLCEEFVQVMADSEVGVG